MANCAPRYRMMKMCKLGGYRAVHEYATKTRIELASARAFVEVFVDGMTPSSTRWNMGVSLCPPFAKRPSGKAYSVLFEYMKPTKG